MSTPRLLVVYKKSQLKLFEEKDPGVLEQLERRDPAFHARFVQAHEENETSLSDVQAAIDERGISADVRYRAERESTQNFDLIVSVGGDGTLLDVSHAVLDRPLMGVNSSVLSVGHFCATDARGFGAALDRWLLGSASETPMNRLEVCVNGVAHPTPVLNEVLFAHSCPAATSRYTITVGDEAEDHKSSGVWIATGAGSTAAIRSAGGALMHPADPRIQFVVREPYRWGETPLMLDRGISESPLYLTCKMRAAALYLDGHREQLELTLGDRFSVDRHASPLRLVGFRHLRTQAPRTAGVRV